MKNFAPLYCSQLNVHALEVEMSQPDFYIDKAAAEDTIKQHQTLMWKVGDLMNQWEALESEPVNEPNSIKGTAKA